MNLRRVFHPQLVIRLLSVAVVLAPVNFTLDERWVTVLGIILAIPALCWVVLFAIRGA